MTMTGRPPLTARLEPWMRDLLADPDACAALIDEFGSPVNVHDSAALPRNANELIDAGAAEGVEVRIFFARKANKTLGLARTASRAGHGLDVASQAELQQVLDAGVEPEKIILSAAIKPRTLLMTAVSAGVVISLDSPDELAAVIDVARELHSVAKVAPRVAPGPEMGLPPTRFGATPEVWAGADWLADAVTVVGVHAHLHGYAARDRVVALEACLTVVDTVREAGHVCAFVDLGGGVPMSYLDDEQAWRSFWAAHEQATNEQITWHDHALANVYPYWQSPTRGAWLRDLLTTPLGDTTAAEALTSRGLRLHLEPGRSLADGCGMTLARVEFTKQRSDGVGLVGLAMNRTQCRTTSDDFLVDPLLVRRSPAGEPFDGFLVGAYCIENEMIMLRRMHFPEGVAAGDVIAIPNTGGYFMHILESASHQIPLACNVVRWPDGRCVLDEIDGGPALPAD